MIPRLEYPRPQLVRGDETWMNLNGKWFFEVDNADSGGQRGLYKAESYQQEIIVPFVPESEASGVCNTDFMFRVWYCRKFVLPEHFDPHHGRVLLHFGAANYETQLWVNDAFMGEHRGGYVPFTFDITEQVNKGENRINVTCKNDVKNPLQPSGKQSAQYANHGCFYTRCTGIWQTVWLEYVPETYIKSVKMLPNVKGEKLDVTVKLSGKADVRAVVSYKGQYVSEANASSKCGAAIFSVAVPDPHLWNVGAPELYDIEFTAGEDKVTSYFGMRDVDIDGNRFLINGKSVFQRLVLDQGYYEKGIYTPLSDDEYVHDIELSMAAGFNGARMHMKIFEPRFIYHADRMGYLLWGEYPNWGLDIARSEAMEAMIPEWIQALERDVNSPAIIGWCPFNESWAKDRVILDTAYYVAKMFDPTRPVIDTSGWVHLGETDIYDVHDYEQNIDTFTSHYSPLVTGEGEVFWNGEGFQSPFAKYDGKKPYFVSEFGGSFWDIDTKVESEDQESGNAWGYGNAPQSTAELEERMISLCTALIDNPGVCGFCYTQLTDVMQEMNGVFAFDRRPKVNLERVHAALSRKAAIED